MKIATAIATIGLVFSGPAIAQQASPRCKSLSEGITAAVKEMSYSTASDVGDNSAPRASVRATQINSAHAEVANRITLMTAHRCSPYEGPLGEKAYLLPAMRCVTASITRETPEAVRAACDRSAWEPQENAL